MLQAAHNLCSELSQLDITEVNHSLKTLKTLLKSYRLLYHWFMFSELVCGLGIGRVCLFQSLQIGRKCSECNAHVKEINLKQMWKAFDFDLYWC